MPAWAYAVEYRQEGGELHTHCRALPEAIAVGATEEEAASEMRQALVAAVRGRIKDAMELPGPDVGPGTIALPTRLAVEAAAYSGRRG